MRAAPRRSTPLRAARCARRHTGSRPRSSLHGSWATYRAVKQLGRPPQDPGREAGPSLLELHRVCSCCAIVAHACHPDRCAPLALLDQRSHSPLIGPDTSLQSHRAGNSRLIAQEDGDIPNPMRTCNEGQQEPWQHRRRASGRRHGRGRPLLPLSRFDDRYQPCDTGTERLDGLVMGRLGKRGASFFPQADAARMKKKGVRATIWQWFSASTCKNDFL